MMATPLRLNRDSADSEGTLELSQSHVPAVTLLQHT